MDAGNFIFFLVIVGALFAMFAMHRGGHGHGAMGGCGGGHGGGHGDDQGQDDESAPTERRRGAPAAAPAQGSKRRHGC